MSKTILVGVDARDFRFQIRRASYGNLGNLDRAMARPALLALDAWVKQVARETLARTKIRSTFRLKFELTTGVRFTGKGNFKELSARMTANPWVYALEYGATVRPKDTKYLALPLKAALRPGTNIPKFRHAMAWKRYGSFIYDHPNGGKFIVRPRRNVAAIRGEAKQTLEFLYVLVEETKVPAILGLRNNWNRMLPDLYRAWTGIWLNAMNDDPDNPINRGFALLSPVPGRSGGKGGSPRSFTKRRKR